MELKQHQQEAIDSFYSYFYDDNNDDNRGIISMCCGSGKSFVSYNIFKKSYKERNECLFIYATSAIKLSDQFTDSVINWAQQDNIDISIYLNSSSTYKKHRKLINKYENINSLNSINNDIKNGKLVLIISVYDSTYKLVLDFINYNINNENNENNQLNPDLIILDESHNTTGAKDEMTEDAKKTKIDYLTKYGGRSDGRTILVIERLSVIKDTQPLIESYNEGEPFQPTRILFLTATPVKIIKSNTASNFINRDLSFSMDNENRYGKIIYSYSFNRGIRDNIIVGWETHLLKLSEDPDSVDTTIDSIDKRVKSLSVNEKNVIYFKTLLRLIVNTVKKHNLYNTIIYTSSKTDIERFEKCLENFNKYNKTPDIILHSLFYDAPNKDFIMNRFAYRDTRTHQLLLCIKMLDEGVDIPSCDSIVFTSNKTNETTIVQNVGRALRNYSTNSYVKEKAIIIIPTSLTIDSSGTIYSSKCKNIREVIDKMDLDDGLDIIYQRKTKTGINVNNFRDEEIIEKTAALVDNVEQIFLDDISPVNIKESTTSILKKETVKSLVDDIAAVTDVEYISGPIGNNLYDKIKREIKESNIMNIHDLADMLLTNKLKCKPHFDFPSEAKSYISLFKGDEYVYKYTEAINKIQSLNLTGVKNAKEFTEKCNKIFDKALKPRELTDEEKYTLNIIINLPFNPLEFYNKYENGFNWEHYLSKNLYDTTLTEVISIEPTISPCNDSKLSNIINKDHYKMFYKIGWNDYNKPFNLSELVNFISTKIKFPFNVKVSYNVDKRHKFTDLLIKVYIDDILTKKPVYKINKNYEIIYEKDLINCGVYNIVPSSSEMEYINCQNIRKEIRNLIDDIKQYISPC